MDVWVWRGIYDYVCLGMYMCVCMYIYGYVYVWICICIYVYVYVWIWIYVGTCVYVYVWRAGAQTMSEVRTKERGRRRREWRDLLRQTNSPLEDCCDRKHLERERERSFWAALAMSRYHAEDERQQYTSAVSFSLCLSLDSRIVEFLYDKVHPTVHGLALQLAYFAQQTTENSKSHTT